MSSQIAMILDGNSMANRAFYALPLLSNHQGIYTNAVYGFAMMLQKLEQEYQPDYLLVAFDRHEPTFRHLEYADYKATRQKSPPELIGQLSLLHDLLDAWQIAWLEKAGFEADDLLGCLSCRFQAAGIRTLLVTGDRDVYQLITADTSVLYTQKRGVSDLQIVDAATIEQQYGLKPQQLIDVKALMGDASDNIPGVPAIGEKTALRLIQTYGSLTAVLEHAAEIKEKKVRENLLLYREQALLSYRLAKIDCNVRLEQPLAAWKRQPVNLAALRSFFTKYDLRSLLEKLPQAKTQVSLPDPSEHALPLLKGMPADRETILSLLQKQQFSALSVQEEPGLLASSDLSFAFLTEQGEMYLYHADDDAALTKIIDLLTKQRFTVWDKKRLSHLLQRSFPLAEDAMLQAYLINPGQKLSLDSFAAAVFPDQPLPQSDSLPITELLQLQRLIPWLNRVLSERSLTALYREIELPLADLLYRMETRGIGVHIAVLQELNREYQIQMDRLQEQIWQMAGQQFNLNSPKQLGQVLFEKLGLAGGKKTKSGFSTDAAALELLADQHEIIALILSYRTLSKLQGTYLQGMIPLISSADQCLHTTYNQAVTATGRLSSSDPNLQNIPTRSEEGRIIRKAFFPTQNGWRLVSADYSQIELRILAHLAQDEAFIDAYRQDQDIHRRTAAEVFNIPFEQVSSLQRNRAKAVNFGIIYGISDYGLATQLHISRAEAKTYIDRFFEEFPAIRRYQDQLIAEAKQNGYVTTLFQRRRYLPELQDRNYNLRSFGERAALNTPIQGSAADLIKLAMLRLQQAIEKQKLQGHILLQVHDELVCETPPEEEAVLKRIMRETMENAIQLIVPIKVELSSGDNWYDLH
ncbi:MAG: DNA polymerase I [Negativicutes bacterium]|nr:DNA polymerase I [Negativicutes bacterium]